MTKILKKAVIAVVLLVVVGGAIALGLHNANQAEATGGFARNAIPVHWAHPQRDTIVSRISARGTVELIDRELVFPATQAQIVAVHVAEGDWVEAGALLVTYDDDILISLRDQLAEAQLALQSARLGLDAARIEPSEAELLTADHQIVQAEHQVVQAEHQVVQARNSIENIEAQLYQIDLNIHQLRENIRTAESSRNDIQVLFDGGVATRAELDNAVDAVRRLEDQVETTIAQRASAALGMPLARESLTLAQESLAVAQESHTVAQAQYRLIRARNETPAALNQAQLQEVAIQQAQLRIAQIERHIAEFEPEERAPVSGTVLNLMVSEGDFSATGRPLLEIADTTHQNLVIRVHVPENEAGAVALGQEVEISGGALGAHAYTGYVHTIHPVAELRQTAAGMETVLTVEIKVPETDRLRAGFNVDADIVTDINEGTLVVPLMATLSAVGGVHFVYVIGPDYLAERRDIQLGQYSGIFVEVFGLSESDVVIQSPGTQIAPGVPVRPITPLGEAGA